MSHYPLRCPRCDRTEVNRHGRAPNGKQRYRCHACSRTFRQDPQPNGYSEERKSEILAAYKERASLRGLTRIFGVSRTTVSAWLKERVETLPPSGGDDCPGGGGRRSGAG